MFPVTGENHRIEELIVTTMLAAVSLSLSSREDRVEVLLGKGALPFLTRLYPPRPEECITHCRYSIIFFNSFRLHPEPESRMIQSFLNLESRGGECSGGTIVVVGVWVGGTVCVEFLAPVQVAPSSRIHHE